jgi:hypothetical protein
MTLKTPRTIPWCERASAKPIWSPVWSLAEAMAAGYVGLDSSNKAKAACLVKASSKPTSLAFLVGTAVPLRCSQIFWGDKQEMGTQETTRKNKFCCTGIYVRHQKRFFNVHSEPRVLKDGITIHV